MGAPYIYIYIYIYDISRLRVKVVVNTITTFKQSMTVRRKIMYIKETKKCK